VANNKKGTVMVEVGGLAIQANLYRNMNGATRDGAMLTISYHGLTTSKHIAEGALHVFDIDVTKDLTPAELAAVSTVLDISQRYAEADLGLT